MKMIFALLGLLLLPHAHAADDPGAGGNNANSSIQELSNPFSDYVPFEDEYDVDEDERFMYFGKFFGVSLGTGMNIFGGNIGKVYNTALPVLDFRLQYFFDFRLAGVVGFSNANHAYDLGTTGYSDVNLMRISVDLKYYFDTKNTSAPIASANPYVIAGIGNTFRTINNQDSEDTDTQIQRDKSFTYSFGAGMEFALKPRKTSLGIEGKIYHINFPNSNTGELESLGVADLTGDMYSLVTSISFYF